MLLDIQNLTITTGGKRLVDGLSLSLAAGERLGLIGESGSGKSLTATAAIGLLPPALVPSGSIRLKGKEVIGARDHELIPYRGAVAATVFQEPLTALDPLMPVGRQIGEVAHRALRRQGAGADGRAVRARVLDLMAQVSLPEPERLIRAYPHEMSGGQRQRVAIAMALAAEPELLIADEPTTALDVTTQAEILNLIDGLVRARNMALLFISHDLPVVAGLVERVLVLKSGVLVEQGPVAEVFGAPQHAYTQNLLAAARRFDDALGGAK